jgi:hypothetical protein
MITTSKQFDVLFCQKRTYESIHQSETTGGYEKSYFREKKIYVLFFQEYVD